MPTTPGVYVEELPSGVRKIAGVSTSVTAFIAASTSGPVNEPVRVSSFADFERKFGALSPQVELGYSVQQFFINGGSDAWLVRVADDPSEDHWREALRALDAVPWFALLVLPGITSPLLVRSAVEYCEKRRSFLILDSPADAKTPSEVRQRVESNELTRSRNAAVYYPWLKISDPLNNGRSRVSAPSGTIAGLIARTDSTRGVWKAPSGLQARLAGVEGLEYSLTDQENSLLNPQAINCLRTFPASGPVAWGSRTLAGVDSLGSEYKYIPVRRLALFLEESLYQGTRWAVFEPNGEALWSQLRQSVAAFLHQLFRQGALQGQTPRDAYFVKCDRETTTEAEISSGRVNLLVGFAPLKPAEFVIIKVQQVAGP